MTRPKMSIVNIFGADTYFFYFLLFTFVELNSFTMTYLTIDTSKKQAIIFLEYLKTLPFVIIHQEPNSTTKKAIDEVKKGKIKKHKNSKELISYLNK